MATTACTPQRPQTKEGLTPALFPLSGGPLPREILLGTFTLLRCSDLASFFCTSRAAISPDAEAILSESIADLIKYRYGKANTSLREDDTSWKRDLATLRFAELRHITLLLQTPDARPGKGFYLSKTWVGNLRRYVEAEAARRRRSSSVGSAGKEKRRRGRDRAESNLMPPWQDINADILCKHGKLARSSQTTPRGKRRTVEKRVWMELVSFFPRADTFHSCQGECVQCMGNALSEKQAEEKVKMERSQEIATPTLRSLFSRKTGVPPSAMAAPLSPGTMAAVQASGISFCPLLPGIYHLLPRFWLTAWRSYIRDPKAPPPRPLDTSLLLCEGHGLLLPPPHVGEFLAGQRRNLLGSLDPSRSGCVSEVLTPEEWDAITLLHPCDFAVRFCVHPDNTQVAWNTRICSDCDPCYIGELYVSKTPRKLSC